MYTLWLVCEEPGLCATLAPYLQGLGRVHPGSPDASHFKDADPPDLVLLALREGGDTRSLERALGFLHGICHPRRAAPPLLWIEVLGGPRPERLRALVDDRRLEFASWPLEPDALAEQAAALLGEGAGVIALRERSRRDWVSTAVARLYAGLDLPSLRQAVAPGNAPQPVLLVGEPGTRRGLLARYIHNLAEPARDELLSIPLRDLTARELESELLERSSGRRATVLLRDIDAAGRDVQEALADLLCDSGAPALDSLRWIASALRADALVARLRQWSWIRVELPPLRTRADLSELASACAAEWSRGSGRRIELSDAAVAKLGGYVWPGNLREFESVLWASLADCSSATLSADELRFAPDRRLEADLGAELFGETARTRGALELPSREGPEAATSPERPEVEIGARVERVGPFPEPPPSDSGSAARGRVPVAEIVAPLADEIRSPLRAIRTYANLVEQRPEDEELRRELSGLVESDLARVEATLQRVERFAGFAEPEPEPVDLSGLLASELQQRQERIRENELVVLRELDHRGPPALADEKQIRFAVGALLDRALRMVPVGGDLYVGSLHRAGEAGGPGSHRLLLRFHSPEEVLITPPDLPGPGVPIEVVLARDLIERMGGEFAVDSSGSQDNLILIELPAAPVT